jgi:hypothetical protein
MVCHKVLPHPSEHGTSSMGKHLLAKAHISKINESRETEVTELTSSKVDETAFAIVKRQKMSKNPESRFAEENQIGHPV